MGGKGLEGSWAASAQRGGEGNRKYCNVRWRKWFDHFYLARGV